MTDMYTDITGLMVNYMENPLGVETDTIKFSWQMKSDIIGQKQSAYEIKLFNADGESVWESGRVENSKSVGIVYSGSALESATRYFWTVDVWDKDGEKHSSEPSYFETAVTGTDIWNSAEFICMIESETAPIFRTEHKLTGEVESARLYITAIGVYSAYINGEEVAAVDLSGNKIYHHMNPGYGNAQISLGYQVYDVTSYIKDSNSVALSVMAGTGWFNANGDVMLGSTLSSPAIKALLTVSYTDGSRSETITDTENWKGTLEGPVRKNGIYYGEDYNAGYDAALGDYKKTGYKYTDKWETELTTVEYTGKLIADCASVGKIIDRFEQQPIFVTLYTGKKDSSSYPGGEIAVDSYYAYEKPCDELYSNNAVLTPKGKKLFDGGVTVKKGQTMIVDMGQNLAAIPEIRFSSVAGSTVYMKFGEMLNDGSKVNTQFVSGSHDASGPKGSLYTHSLRNARAEVQYTFGNTETIETYQTKTSFFGYRYISITADENVTVYSLRSRAVSSVNRQTGKIITNNADVNRLFLNALYGQLSNYFTTITDCPQRDERLAWTGDAQVFAQTGMYNFDSVSFLIKYQNNISEKTFENGYPASVVSLSPWFDNWASGWSDVEIINPYTIYSQTGDKSVITDNWKAMNRYMAYLKDNERAEYCAPTIARSGFGDWLAFQGTGYEVIADYYYGYVTKLMSELSLKMGDKEKNKYYNARFEKLKKKFLSNHVVYENGNLIIKSATGSPVMQNKGGVYEDNSQTALLWMLKLGYYSSDEMRDEAVKLLVENIKNEKSRFRQRSCRIWQKYTFSRIFGSKYHSSCADRGRTSRSVV